MDNNIKKDTKMSTTNMTVLWFKENILYLILLFMCLGYISYGIIKITKSGKTVIEILGDAGISLIWGMTFTMIMSRIEVKNATRSDVYQSTMGIYGDELEEATSHIEKLDCFCDEENENELKRRQSKILSKEKLTYDSFINERYCYIKMVKDKETNKKHPIEEIPEGMINLDKNKWKCVKRAKNVSFYGISADNLMSEMSIQEESRGKKESTINQYLRKCDRKDAITKIVFAIITAYYAMTLNFSKEAIITSIVRITIWLGMGIVGAIQKGEYIQNDYRNKIIRKSNHLHKFNNLMNENPNRYNKEVIKNVESI